MAPHCQSDSSKVGIKYPKTLCGLSIMCIQQTIVLTLSTGVAIYDFFLPVYPKNGLPLVLLVLLKILKSINSHEAQINYIWYHCSQLWDE